MNKTQRTNRDTVAEYVWDKITDVRIEVSKLFKELEDAKRALATGNSGSAAK